MQCLAFFLSAETAYNLVMDKEPKRFCIQLKNMVELCPFIMLIDHATLASLTPASRGRRGKNRGIYPFLISLSPGPTT